MTRIFCVWTGGLLAGAVVLLAGCQQGADVRQTEEGSLVLGSAEVQEAVSRAVAPGARTLVLDGFAGDVVLTASVDAVARFTFTKRARGDDAGAARRNLERIRIEESGDAQTYRYLLRADRAELSRVDVEGTVPRGATLHILLRSGNVSLDGLEGPITVTNENGNVRITGAGAGVTVQTANGNVAVGMNRLPAGESVRLTTVNGNVTLALPAAVSARIEAGTSAGEIRVDGLTFADRRLDPQGAGGHFQGRLGTGAATVTLKTENGNIVLREGPLEVPPAGEDVPADTAMAPPADTSAAVPPGPAPVAVPPDTTGGR
ncbi:DUF4097 family beta strand repeat protein [Rhodocaloribacter litoris]|uniref:DUF4097 family beta strand repeat-containing protein n=1 Tax=Rhodocaloribacter litoris TaxID=2558931 RepID=UPI001423F5E8|nr:DUF4097 family beta strand repeat-containing protein [Rhodocaloribacter litoris]QXD14650.1 DUF4097 family beta strand repeat protein [Rhodocaloribacter litoris]